MLAMATVVRLDVCPESFDYLCFKGHHSRRSLRRGFCWSSPRRLLGGRNGLCLNRCRAFKSEYGGGHLEEKKVESEEEEEEEEENQILVNLNREKGFWVSMKSIMLKTYKANPKSDDEYRQAVAKVEEVLSAVALQIGRYIVTMMSTGVILTIGFLMSGGDSQMDGLIWYSWVGGIIIGTMIGANMVLEEHCRAGPRNVIITGSTRGLGKALAREFLLSGDRVVVTSRSHESVQATTEELEESLKEGIASAVGSSLTKLSHAKVVGIACDVCDPRDVQRLANFAVTEFGCIDIWINNAGANKGFRPLLQFSDEDIRQIVLTNLVGSIICTREAIRIMKNQPKGAHIFNVDGAGSGGSSTPLTAVYGSTKCGLRQFQGSLLKECKRSKVGVHSASPGMVLTDLLLSGSTVKNRQMFNIICELPETVARTLVPRMRVVKGTGKAVNYLTPPRILFALITAWLRRGRWFDDQGRALYAAEADRLRNWAENRTRFSITDAMEMYTENTWVSVFSLSVVCAFIILSSTSSNLPGT